MILVTFLRYTLTAALLYWVWTGSRVALVLTLLLITLALEQANTYFKRLSK